jgi:hypothetical protein
MSSGNGDGAAGGEKGRVEAQLFIVKSAEPLGVGVSALRRPNGRIVPLPTGILLNLITSLSESRNSSRPDVGMMIELRRPQLTTN